MIRKSLPNDDRNLEAATGEKLPMVDPGKKIVFARLVPVWVLS